MVRDAPADKLEDNNRNGERLAKSRREWQAAALYGFIISVVLLALHGYWFGIADRYILFLYYHAMGPLVPDTSPFGVETSSRYWMAGLVADGAILVLYTSWCWLLERLGRTDLLPHAWRIWAVCAAPLAIGILLITMTLNAPTLPLPNALQVISAGLIGLGLALAPGRTAAQHPAAFWWLLVAGCALTPLLTVGAQMGQVPFWLHTGRTIFAAMVAVSVIGSLGLLLILRVFYVRRYAHTLPFGATLLAAGCVSYLVLPLMHHLVFTDGYHYISSSSNFFAGSIMGQLVAWIFSAGAVWGILHIRSLRSRA